MLEMQNKQQKFLSGTTTIHLDQIVNVLETPYSTKVGRLSLLQFMYSIALQLDGSPSQPPARPSEADESSDSEKSVSASSRGQVLSQGETPTVLIRSIYPAAGTDFGWLWVVPEELANQADILATGLVAYSRAICGEDVLKRWFLDSAIRSSNEDGLVWDLETNCLTSTIEKIDDFAFLDDWDSDAPAEGEMEGTLSVDQTRIEQLVVDCGDTVKQFDSDEQMLTEEEHLCWTLISILPITFS